MAHDAHDDTTHAADYVGRARTTTKRGRPEETRGLWSVTAKKGAPAGLDRPIVEQEHARDGVVGCADVALWSMEPEKSRA